MNSLNRPENRKEHPYVFLEYSKNSNSITLFILIKWISIPLFQMSLPLSMISVLRESLTERVDVLKQKGVRGILVEDSNVLYIGPNMNQSQTFCGDQVNSTSSKEKCVLYKLKGEMFVENS